MAALHTKLAAVMEAMVHAAVAELKKLVEGGSLFPDRLPSDTWETMVRVVPRPAAVSLEAFHHVSVELMTAASLWELTDRC